MDPLKIKPKALKIKRGPTSLVLFVITAAMFLLAIWTGDVRWAQTAPITLVPAVFIGALWFSIDLFP